MTVPSDALILHNSVTHESPADARDVLDQVNSVQQALSVLGYRVSTLAVDLRLDELKKALTSARPQFVFNLVEAIEDNGRLVPLATAVLEHLKIPYTGSGTETFTLTSNKLLAKRWLRAHGISTPDWWSGSGPLPTDAGEWIVKLVGEDASIGLDDTSVVRDPVNMPKVIERKSARIRGQWFGERFIEGREVNVAMLAHPGGPQVLPLPEIIFVDYPPGKPRIVGYDAKWAPESFECRNTIRRFIDRAAESTLCGQLAEIALRCWKIFELRGYARVDFRVDRQGQPWVLEVNANPCISPEAGFAAALEEAGVSYSEGIRRIVAAAVNGQA